MSVSCELVSMIELSEIVSVCGGSIVWDSIPEYLLKLYGLNL